ncbi:MAG: PilZ domain-containing protein [Sandaracinaceae bacterium]
MHLATERRAPDANRVPLDLWVRLRHEDYAEPFDADGVDLSRGGLSLRADFLPEVGDRMRCRFDSPSEGEEIDLGGEVVWAHDSGERGGQFGLRFTDLDDRLGDSLSQIVRRVAPDAFVGGTLDEESPATPRVRLHLDGVASPVEADLVERDDEWICAEQSLPFLKPGMGVVVEGSVGPPRGRLAAVSLRVEDGMPRLVLQVDLEQEARSGPDTLDEAPVETAPADDEELARASAPVEFDATLQDYMPPVDVVADPGRDAQAVRVFATSSKDEEGEAALADDGEYTDEARDEDSSLAADEGEDSIAAEAAPSKLAQLSESKFGVMASAQLAKAKAKTSAALGAVKEKAGPTARAWFAKFAALFALALQKAGPKGKAAWEKIRATAATVGGIVARKVLKKGKRRTTARPPRRVAESPRLRRQRKDEPVEAPKPKIGRRVLALSLLAFAAVGMGVYALSGDDAEATPDTESEVESLPSLEAAPSPVTAAPVSAAEPVAEANPEEGGAVVVPSGGQLEAPSFPSLREASQREAPVREGTSFGAASVEGRASTIRMSQPVSTMRGQEQDGGFTITIPGSLALDRAGPIAAAHPAIERATILNRGDHAVLTVRFVAGRTPAYRIVAQGSAVQLTVAR